MNQINQFQETAVSRQSIQQIQSNVKVTLAEVMGDASPEMLNEMSSIFLEDAIPLINQMKSGYSNHDLKSISMAAHALKGSSATIGLEQFSDLCLAVETSSKQNEAEPLIHSITLLEAEYVRVEQALTGFLI